MGISAWNKKMVWGHFISDIIDSDVLKILLWTREVFSAYVLVWKTKTFSYTWTDQVFEVPEDCNMTIECWGAWSNNASWWYAKWVIPVTKWQKLSFMIWWNWGRTNDWTTYWFGWSTTYWGRWGWWLSWVFTWDTAIGANDASRVLVIAWWAWGGRTWGWAWGWETWQNWNSGSYWYPWAWGTQTWRWNWGNTRSEQFRWGGWSWTYWFGWGWWWRWWNGSWWDGSWDDDAQAGWGSGYVLSSASDRVLTQWGWSAAGQDWSVKIRYLVKERPQPTPTVRLPIEYQEVEYIESNGTQYIDTGVTRSICQLPIIEYKFYSTWAAGSTDYWLLWFWPSNSNGYILWVSQSQFRFVANSSTWWSNSGVAYSSWIHTFTTDESYPYIDWNRLSWNSWNMQIWTSTWTIWLMKVWWWWSQQSMTQRAYYCKISDTNWNAIRDLVPCYRRIDWVIWMYDLVNDQFYANAWSWIFWKWWEINTPALPSEYMEVEYLQSICSWAWATSSWQIIDTLFVPTNKTRVWFKMSWWTQSWTSNQIFWEDVNWTQWDWGFAIVTDNYSYNWPASNRPTWFNDWAVHHWTMWFNWVYRDWTLVDNSRAWQALNATQTISLFWLRRNWTYVEHSSCKIHYFIIEEDWVLVKFFMPCYRKLDNKPWMYDLINKEFYINVWTGEFTLWRPISYRINSNTLSYFPLYDSAVDVTWNRTLTLSWATISGWALNINASGNYTKLNTWIWWSIMTASLFYYYQAVNTTAKWNSLLVRGNWDYHHLLISAWDSIAPVISVPWFYNKDAWNTKWYPWSKAIQTWKWYHFVVVKNWVNEKIYCNWELLIDSNASFDNNTYPITIIWSHSDNGSWQWALWKISECIFEDRAWSEEDITNYLNMMKDRYNIE